MHTYGHSWPGNDRRPLATRWIARVVLLTQMAGLLPIPAGAVSADAADASAAVSAPASAAAPVAVNRRILPASPPALFTGFSAEPADAEFLRASAFSEVLLPIGGRTSRAENRALAAAISRYMGQSDDADAAPLTAFLRAFPGSVWKPSLLLNLGRKYQEHGDYARALSAWNDAWQSAKHVGDARGREVAHAAVADWTLMSARLGRVSEVRQRLTEIGTRDIGGAAGSRLARAREHLRLASQRAGTHPSSEQRAFDLLRETVSGRAWSNGYASGTSGASHPVTALLLRARRDGYPLQAVRRRSGASIPVPALLHLRVGHVVAVVAAKGGYYLVRDPVFSSERWMSHDALDEQISGDALMPATARLAGWSPVSASAIALSIIICPPGSPDDEQPQCELSCRTGGCGGASSPPSSGLASYSLQASTASLWIHDTPVSYVPPKGPAVAFTLAYNHRGATLPSVFAFGNLGPKWMHSWLSYVTEMPVYCPPNADCLGGYVDVFLRGGGSEAFEGEADVSGTFPTPHWRSHAVLVRTSTTPLRYERRLPDGSVERFALPDGLSAGERRKVFLTELVDPHGQRLQFTYDAEFRIVAVTDAVGQVTTVSYDLPADPLKITAVTDPFGRSALFAYTGVGQLAQVTDVGGLVSKFTYAPDDFVSALTTPYGVTTFRHETFYMDHRLIEATDPVGGTERLTYHMAHSTLASTVAAADVPDGFGPGNRSLNEFVTLFWDKRAMSINPGDLASATVTRWLLRTGRDRMGAVAVEVPRTVKRPLERRVWYGYSGSAISGNSIGTDAQPSLVGRVLDNGASQLTSATFNRLGRVTARTDPSGRVTSYTYAANGIDLQEVRQTTGGANDLLAQYSGYNAQHLPTTVVDAAGQSTTLTYNAAGQVLTVTNAKSETTTNVYDADGYLQSVTGPVSGATTAYTYDSYGRIRTTTDADGYVVTTDYDLFDRPVKTTYPDATFEQTAYDRLDPVRRRDRLGRWSYTFYDALRRVVATRDPLGRTIQQQWCSCGSLDALIDGKGQKTRWERDLQGRVTREVRADNVTATAYTYEAASGRLKTVTDPKLQVTTYTYNLDDSLQQVAYTNAQIATPSVSYTYETAYNRLATMVDGIGTTTYGYKAAGTLGAGQVASVDGPLTDDTITYTYDQLGRVTVRAINGVANQTTQTYDALGRVTTEVNPLGSFTYGYDGVTPRLASVAYPNGQTSAYAYYNNAGDHRLQTIHHKRPGGATLSKFDYAYDAVGNIATWQQQADSDPPVEWRYTYDGADQLLTAYQWSTGTPSSVLKRYAYTYDLAANRTTEQIDDGVTLSTYDVLNRLVARQAGGPLRLAGTVDEPALVTIQGRLAPLAANGQFSGALETAVGTTRFTVEATDASGNSRIQRYDFDLSGPSRVFTSDASGNLISDGSRTFEWDARGQLATAISGSRRLDFSYDGLRRRGRLIERQDSIIQDDVRLLWCESTICEQRGSDGVSVSHRMFAAAEQAETVSYSAADHLGSVRDVVSASGALLARYDFDPWGRRSRLEGSHSTVVGFTGHRWQERAEMWLTWYRAYDADLGRWSSEDPLRLHSDSVNLYVYVRQQPVRLADVFGLQGHAAGIRIAHFCDFHRYRNVWNRCPANEPSGGGFEFDRIFKKYRNEDGSECKYDDCGKLMPDDGNNYTFNYGHSYDSPTNFASHVWWDVLPNLYCGSPLPNLGRGR